MHREPVDVHNAPTLPLIRPFGLTRDDRGRLTLTDAEGRQHGNVRPVRAFPLTDPDHWIAVLSDRGQELVLIDDLHKLAEPVRRLLQEELARRDFIPRVERIVRITAAPTGSRWQVETDRGPTSFRLESDDAIRPLADGRVLLIDSHGIRYLIPGAGRLDHASRRRLERYL